jgi:micrococcal nuclease
MLTAPTSPAARSWLAALVLSLAGFVFPAPAAAEDGKRPAACGSEPAVTTEAGKVTAVLDGRTFVLEDGRELRLAGIEVPATLPASGGGDGAALPAAHAAKAALEELVAGRTVSLKRFSPESDRYGRRLVHAFVAGAGDELWVQGALVAQGHARVAARLDSCAKELLPSERSARAAGLGLWGDPQFRLRPAENPTDILAERGRFALVEGKIISVRESGGTVYLNFGRVWTRDFAVTVLKRNERLFTASGMELKKLEGRRIRIRGWVEERGGPRIEAHGPEQIEIAERN